MSFRIRLFSGIIMAVALFVSVSGQQAGLAEPTKKDPLRFRAQLRTQGSSPTAQGVMQIAIERWTTDSERKSLLDLVGLSNTKDGQKTLLRTLERVKPRTGYIRLPNSPGWDLRYAYKFSQPDGSIQIVLATDKPMTSAAIHSSAYSTEFPYTFVEMHMQPAGDKGEGRMLAQAGITSKEGRIQLTNYGNEPLALTDITTEQKKKD
jgi:hypothetical protein